MDECHETPERGLPRISATATRSANDRARRIEAAKADPVRHKKTLQWDSADLRWRYFEGGIDRRGVRRRFCVDTTTRNAAGYFLSFVEVYDTKKGRGERKNFVASKTRHRMKDRARKLYRAWADRRKKEA
jgi:hypothetical protein